jgi:hypothetical protein
MTRWRSAKRGEGTGAGRNLTDEEITRQDGGLAEGAQGAPQAPTVEAGKNANDIGGMSCDKEVGDAVGRGVMFYDATLVSPHRQRRAVFSIFGSGFAGVSNSRARNLSAKALTDVPD